MKTCTRCGGFVVRIHQLEQASLEGVEVQRHSLDLCLSCEKEVQPVCEKEVQPDPKGAQP